MLRRLLAMGLAVAGVVEDICKEGDEMLVKVIGIDRASGKVRLHTGRASTPSR